MKKTLLSLAALLCLQGCADMPAYSNVDSTLRGDESRYAVLETDTYASRNERHIADGKPYLNIIRINDKKVGDIPFSTYYYRNDSPQRAELQPGIYTVQLQYRLPRHFMFADLQFEAKPGQKLMARSQYIGVSRLNIWLEDVATGEVVSKRVN